MNPPAAMAQHTAAASAKSKQPSFSGFELREGCCGQFLPAAETHPPARTLLVVRTGASVTELSNAAHSRCITRNRILARRPLRVNTRHPSGGSLSVIRSAQHLGLRPTSLNFSQ